MSNIKSTITVLTCQEKGKKATKEFLLREDGTIKKRSFSAGRFFTHEEKSVSNLEELSLILESLLNKPKMFVIRGAAKKSAGEIVRRKIHEPNAAFTPVSRPYVMLDIDKLICPKFFDPAKNPEEMVIWVQENLPEPFRDISCHYKFSASQNVPNKSGEETSTISMHLWYWCDREVLDEEWKRFFKANPSPADIALFSAVQIHYTARPVFKGIDDPLPQRSGVFKGKQNVVTVPEIPVEKPGKSKPRPQQEPEVTQEDRDKALSLLLPYYKEGVRNDLCGAIAATVYRRGWSAENAADFVYELAEISSDPETAERYSNAMRICDAVDNNRPAPGIPTLKNKLHIKNLEDILKVLGAATPDIQEVISKLNNQSSSDEIREAMEVLITLSSAEQNMYLDEIKRNTKFSKPSLKSLLEEVQRESSSFCTTDWGDITALSFLNGHYRGGKHFLRTSDKRYWRYNQLYWEAAPDDLVKQDVIDCAREITAENELQINLSNLINAALNILEGESYKRDNPFGLVNKEVPMVINCQNGELWFDEQGEVTLKPHRGDSYLRYCLDVDYDPFATSPKFDHAVLEIFANSSDPEDMFRHFMELAGYICQPWRKIPIIVLWHGGGGNGKSTLINIISRMLGNKMVMSGVINDIGKDKFKIGALDGKLLLFEDDMRANTRLDDGFLKTISEKKFMTGEHKYKDHFEFICRAVPVMLANDFPSVSDLTDGLRRRMMVIPFARQFEKKDQQKELFDTLWEEEASGILNQFIEGFRRVKKRQDFLEPDDCIKAKNKWLTRSNILPAFIEDLCEIGTGYTQSLKDMYGEFVQYCEETGSKPIPRQQWVRSRLENLGYEISELNGAPVVRGIRAVSQDFKKIK